MIVAPGKTAPLASLTVPAIEPVTWAEQGSAVARMRASGATQRNGRGARITVLLQNLLRL